MLIPVFLTGLLGGMHCIGMCGGIVSAFSAASLDATILTLVYNAGSIGSYAIAGGVAEGLLFSLVDPQEVHFFGSPVELPPLAVYTMGFFYLRLFCAPASLLNSYLATESEQR